MSPELLQAMKEGIAALAALGVFFVILLLLALGIIGKQH